MFDDPNFAYTYIRPVAVMAGLAIGYQLGWNALDRYLEKRERERERERDADPPRERP